MELNDIVDYTLRKVEAMGVSEAEVYVQEIRSTSIRKTYGDLRVARRGEVIELGIRIALGKKVTVQGGTIAEYSDIDRILEAAVRAAKVASEDPYWHSLPRGLSKAPVENVWDKRIAEPSIDSMIEEIEEAFTKAKEVDTRCYTSAININLYELRRTIGNSYGEVVSDSVTRIAAFVHVKAKESGEESGFYEQFYASTLTGFDLGNLVERAARRAIEGLYARPIETGRYNVVLTSKVFAAIVNALIVPAVSIEWVRKRRSPLANRLGDQIFSDIISIVDDGAAQNLAASASFDDEGIRMQRKIVVDRGVLETYLYDYYHSVLESKEPMGNGIRQKVSSAPRPWATNFIVLPGQASLEDLVRDIGRGIVIYQTIGEWLSNPVNGFLNATVTNAVLVENGEVKSSVKGVVISDNIYELLKDRIIGLASDVENYMNVYAPSIALENVTIAGK